MPFRNLSETLEQFDAASSRQLKGANLEARPHAPDHPWFQTTRYRCDSWVNGPRRRCRRPCAGRPRRRCSGKTQRVVSAGRTDDRGHAFCPAGSEQQAGSAAGRRRKARRRRGSGGIGQVPIGNIPVVGRQVSCRAIHGRPDRRSGCDADRHLAAGSHRSARGPAGDGLRDVGADEELPRYRPAGRAGRGSVGEVGRRSQDRRRAGRRGARRPAIQAKPAAGADRGGQVAVPGADPEPA